MSIDYDQDATFIDMDIRDEQEKDDMLEDHERRLKALETLLKNQ